MDWILFWIRKTYQLIAVSDSLEGSEYITRPLVRPSNPARMDSVVDLPAPFAPCSIGEVDSIRELESKHT